MSLLGSTVSNKANQAYRCEVTCPGQLSFHQQDPDVIPDCLAYSDFSLNTQPSLANKLFFLFLNFFFRLQKWVSDGAWALKTEVSLKNTASTSCDWLCFFVVVALPGRLCCCYPFLALVTAIGIVSKTIAVINRLSCWDVKIKAAQLQCILL